MERRVVTEFQACPRLRKWPPATACVRSTHAVRLFVQRVMHFGQTQLTFDLVGAACDVDPTPLDAAAGEQRAVHEGQSRIDAGTKPE